MENIKKKTPEQASNVFHNIMAASVKGNPKPKEKVKETKKTTTKK